MEILADSSIPEPSRQVPLQQRLIERAASRPMDPVLRQNFDNMQDRGQAQHNAQLTAVRQQQVQASITGPAHQQPVQGSITNQDRSRNSRGNFILGRMEGTTSCEKYAAGIGVGRAQSFEKGRLKRFLRATNSRH
jgi:hypothetical protein